MTGIRKRVTVGFLSIVALLFFSGLVSLFELSRMSNDIEAILGNSRRSLEISKGMLDAVRANDRSVVGYAVFRDSTYADSCRLSLVAFDEVVRRARTELSATAGAGLDSLEAYSVLMYGLIDRLPVRDTARWRAFDGRAWYDERYVPVYDRMTEEIAGVISSVHGSLDPRAEQLNRNAYRSVTPVFISLAVMIVILLLFYYFVMIYNVRPIVEMNDRLGDYLRYKLPFSVKAECHDEMRELKEKIESLTNTPPKAQKQADGR